jgi:hypothetical protein
MKYILKAAQDLMEQSLIDIYTIMAQDLELDPATYQLHFKSMADHLFLIHSYTTYSALVKDIENGVWNVIGLDNHDYEQINDFSERVACRANDSYIKHNQNEAKFSL